MNNRGTRWAPNITPDPEYGIGKLSDGQIVRAVRERLDHNNRVVINHYSVSWRFMPDEDMRAIIAYMRAQPASQQPSHEPKKLNLERWWVEQVQQPVFRAGPKGDGHVPMPQGDAERTVFYKNTCIDCHTAYGEPSFAGGKEQFSPEWGLHVVTRNITPDPTGIGNMSEDSFVSLFKSFLETGIPCWSDHPPPLDKPILRPNSSMPWSCLAQQLEEHDLRLVYRYLMTSVKPVHRIVDPYELQDEGSEKFAHTYGEYLNFIKTGHR
jgi:hypothetical protein